MSQQQRLSGIVETKPDVFSTKYEYPFTFTMRLDDGNLAEVFISKSLFHEKRKLIEIGNKLCLVGSEVESRIVFVADKVE